MSTDDEAFAIDAARKFMAVAEYAENIEEMLTAPTRMAVGVEPNKARIVLSIGDEYEFMSMDYAEVVVSGLIMAMETLRMLEASRSN